MMEGVLDGGFHETRVKLRCTDTFHRIELEYLILNRHDILQHHLQPSTPFLTIHESGRKPCND
jgi:hypothetical protein